MSTIKYKTKKLIDLIESEIEINKFDPEKCIISDSYSDNHLSSIDFNVSENNVSITFKVHKEKIENPITVAKFIKVLKIAADFSNEIIINLEYNYRERNSDLITGISFEKNINIQDYMVDEEDYDYEDEANRVMWFMLIFH